MRVLLLLLGLLLRAAATQAQSTPPDSARTVALPEVAVQGQLTRQVVGTFHDRYIRGTRPLTPAARCAIWLPAPDSGQVYTLTSLVIPLHCRFTAGRLQVSFHARGAGAELLGPALLTQPFLITPPDSIPKRRTQVRLDLRAAGLQLPPAGVYVVLEGLPTFPDEQFIRLRSVPIRKTKKDGSTAVRMFALTRRGTDTTTIWTPHDAFPKLRQSPAGYVTHTWMRWAPSMPYRRESVHFFRGKSIEAFDTVVLLELESAQ